MKRGLVGAPDAPYADRLRALQERLRDAGAGLGLVYGDVSRSDDILHLTGLCIYWNEGVLGVPADGEAALLSKLSKRVHPWMRATSTLTDLRSGRDLAALIADFAGGARRIALVDRGLWPAQLVRELQDACAPAELVDLPGAVRAARLAPAERELPELRELGSRLGAVLGEALALPGRDALAHVERRLRGAGALDVVAVRDESPDGSVTLDVRVQQHGRWLRAARCAGGPDAERASAALAGAAGARGGAPDARLAWTSHADLAPGAPAPPVRDGGLLVGEAAHGGARAAATFLLGAGGAEALTRGRAMPAWDDVIPSEDAAALAGEWGRPPGEGTRPALLIVDMTRAFADPRFPLGCAGGPACAAAIAPLLATAREAGRPVIFSTGMPAANAAERGLWRSSGRPPDPALGDPHEIVPELAPAEDESVVRKRRPSAFFGTELASLLTHHGADSVVLCGMVTSGCVRATAVDAFSHNLHVVVPEEGVADRARVPHAVALFDIAMKYGAVVAAAEAAATLRGAEVPA